VPPFVIFSDASLQEMAYFFPADKVNFEKISGVGARKLESFGDDFLRIINAHLKENNLHSREIIGRRTKARAPRHFRPVDGDTSSITIELIKRGLSIIEMAQARGLAPSTIASHIERLVASGEKLNLDYLKPPPEIFKIIKAAFVQCGGEQLKPVFEFLNGEYDYEVIRLVRAMMKSENKD
jgi:ATP-dependent DNA helicase RecQ